MPDTELEISVSTSRPVAPEKFKTGKGAGPEQVINDLLEWLEANFWDDLMAAMRVRKTEE